MRDCPCVSLRDNLNHRRLLLKPAMNKGPNAITAAAAIAVLMAPHPVMAYTQPLARAP